MVDLNLGDTQDIIKACESKRLLRTQIAYVLATAYWETAHTMKPVREGIRLSEASRKKRFHRYYPYYGRGYAQLTWDYNYRKASGYVDVDLVSDPDKALEPEIALVTLVTGMIEGWFTGKNLFDYINDHRTNYIGARKIINGIDKARPIAVIAREYESVLAREGIGVEPEHTSGTAHTEGRYTLRKGMRGPLVKQLQQRLHELNFACGDADGDFGTLTFGAVMKFQAHEGLETDGIVGPTTWAALDKAEPFRRKPVAYNQLLDRSRTLQAVEKGKATIRALGIGGTAATVKVAADSVQESVTSVTGALDLLNVTITQYWPVLTVGAVALVAGWVFLHQIGAWRLDDRNSGKHIGGDRSV